MSLMCSIHPLPRYTLLPLEKSEKLMAVGITMLALFFIGMGLYGHFKAPHMWGSYVVIGLGSAAILGSLVCFVRKKVALEKKDAPQSHLSIKTKKIDLSTMVIAEAYKDNGLKKELNEEGIIFNILQYLDDPTLVRVMQVCKSWYLLLAKHKEIAPRLENGKVALKIEALCNKYKDISLQMSEFMQKIFVPGSAFFNSIRLIKDMQVPGTKLKGTTGYPEVAKPKKLDLFLNLFEREKVPVLKGQDVHGRWWILIRASLEENGTSTDGVIVYFQRDTGLSTWRPLVSYNFDQKLQLHFAAEDPTFFINWLKKLLNNERCGAPDYLMNTYYEADAKGIFTLWKP